MIPKKVQDSDIMWVAFHKGNKGGFKDRLVSNIIKLYTFGKYSHVELIFPEWVLSPNCKGRWFSSRGMDNPNGVSFKDIKMSHPERWDLFPVLSMQEVSAITEAYRTATNIDGGSYDFKGIFSYFGPLWTIRKKRGTRKDNQHEWWCSEAVAYVLSFGKYKVSPNELYRLFKKRERLSI